MELTALFASEIVAQSFFAGVAFSFVIAFLFVILVLAFVLAFDLFRHLGSKEK